MIRSFNGKTPKIAASAFISEAAYVVGDVEIGENSSVWPGAVIRGDTGHITIGSNVAVEDNCVIHSGMAPDADVEIGDMAHIGHGAIVHARRVGDNVLIGVNATVLHGAVIGKMSIIGAACLVSQDMQVPDCSFVVGVPGKVKGQVPSNHLHWVKEAPLFYADLCRQYKEAGL